MAFDAMRSLLGAALLTAAMGASSGTGTPDAPFTPTTLAITTVKSGAADDGAAYDGVVQAVRQTVLATQVPGAVVALEVRAGDIVKAGQILLRLDARAAEQTAAAGAAQLQAALAAQTEATREFERQKLLFQKNFISQSALDRAEAQHKSALAQASAQLASAGASRTQSGFYVVRAPYAGVVSDVAVVLGDMAMPGRPLLTLYDPTALRVSVNVPQTAASRFNGPAPARLELPGLPADRQWPKPVKTQILPTVDPSTHTLELRLDLPAGLPGVAPGMFARAWLPASSSGDARLYVPLQSVVQRAELSALYVVGADGRTALRQVRLGRIAQGQVEVLAGVSAGERVALDPQAAARIR